jgi:SAM-dependent methyltransferase
MFDGKYLDWNQKRIKGIIEYYGHTYFFNKKILDLGCGHGDISGALYRLGGDVTAVDARQEHLKIVSKKFPGIKTVKADLDGVWPFLGKNFDLILDLDLLCHLNDYQNHLRAVCLSTNNLILETSVCDSDDPYKCIVLTENKGTYDLSANGVSSRPSSAAIERVFNEYGMNFKRIDQNKFNSGTYTYDWQTQKDNSCDINKRRIWFASKGENANKLTNIQVNSMLRNPITLKTSINPLVTTKTLFSPPLPPAPIPASDSSAILGSIFRIAVCISGNLRTFEKTYSSFMKNILSPYENKCDFFIHTWDNIGCDVKGFDKSISSIKTKDRMNKINLIYNPKSIVIDNSLEIRNMVHQLENKMNLTKADRDGLAKGGIADYGCMLYSWNKSRELLEKYQQETGIRYDIVIRLRTDLMFTDKFDIRRALNKLCVPNIGQFYNNAMNDQFAIGPYKDICVYLSLYDHIVEYFNGRVTSMLRPELLLKYHLNKSGISYIEENISYHILRPNNKITTMTSVKQSK